MIDYSIQKYPRTPHIEGSRLQAGDDDLIAFLFAKSLVNKLSLRKNVTAQIARFLSTEMVRCCFRAEVII